MNPWAYKPWWCQPWSILLTGMTCIVGTWLLTQVLWLTVLIALPIFVWMGFFLLIWPKLMSRYLALNAVQEQSQAIAEPGSSELTETN